MSLIFISHSSEDNEVSAELHHRLAEQGHRSVFLDFEPADGIAAGREWEQELYRQLRVCQAVIVLCSQHSMASPWCFAEITHSKALGKHIFPVKIDDCSVKSVLLPYQVLDLKKDKEDAFRRLWRGLKQAGLDPADLFDWDGSRPPYPGLMAYQETDAPVFFGRNSEIQSTLELLNRLRQFGGARMVTILGASGSGKSSLVRAGIVPRLKKNAQWWLVVDPFRPEKNPVQSLAVSLAVAFARYGETRSWQDIRDSLQRESDTDPAQSDAPLIELIYELRIAAGQQDVTVILIIDQAEELLGVADKAQAHYFISLLRAGLSTPGCPLMALCTLRSDFLGMFQQHSTTRDLVFEDIRVGPMLVDHVVQVIEGPAKIAGLELEPGLTEALVQDMETDDALPLLAFTMRELFEYCGAGGMLRIDVYREKLGGLAGSIAKAAEAVLANQGLSPKQEDDLRRSFLAMVTINVEGQFGRRAAYWDNLPASVHGLLEQFVQARLLVSQEKGGQRLLEVAHESLFRSWGRLKKWLDDDREFLLWRRRMFESRQEWERTNQDEGALLRGAPLSEAERWLGQRMGDLTAEELAFVQKSLSLREQERMLQDRRRRRLMVSALGAALIFLILASLAFWQTQQARREERISRHLAYASDLNLAEYSLAQLDAKRVLELLERHKPVSGHKDLRDFTWYYLWRRYHGNRLVLPLADDPGTLTISGGEVGALAISPDSKVLAAAMKDRNTVTLIDALTGQQRLISTHEYENVNALDFALGGKLLVTASEDKTVRLWDIATGMEQGTLPHDEKVVWLSVSPDGETLFTITEQHFPSPFRLWDMKTLEQRNSPEGLEEPFGHGSFSSYSFADDSKTLALGYERGLVILIDILKGQERARLKSTRDWRLQEIDFSPDGKTLALGFSGGNNEVRLWDLVNNRETLTLPVIESKDNKESYIMGLAFAPDGKTLALMSGDPDIISPQQNSELTVFDVGSGKELFTLEEAQTGFVTTFAFSPDGKTLATGGKDHSVLLWDGITGSPINAVGLHTDRISHLKFFPDGKTLATAGHDLQVKVWDMNVKDYFEIPQQGDFHSCISFSPDNTTVAVGGKDGTITLWNLSNFEKIIDFQAHAAGLHNIAFDPEGLRLASESADGTLKVWNAATGSQLVSFSGHRFEGFPIDIGGLFFDGNRLISAPRPMFFGNKLEPSATIEWDLATGKRSNSVRDSAFSKFSLAATGKVAATVGGFDVRSGSYQLKLWNLTTGQQRLLESRKGITITHLAFSHDARFLAAGGPAVDYRIEGGSKVDVSGVKLFDIATAKEHHLLPVPVDFSSNGSLASLSFSYDGNLLAIASALYDEDGRIAYPPKPAVTLWDVRTGKKLHTLIFESEKVCLSGQGSSCLQSTIFSPDGRTLAMLTDYQTPGSSGSSENGIITSWGGTEIALWDVESGKERQNLHFSGRVETIVFSPDSRHLAAIMPDGPVTLWDVTTGRLTASLGEDAANIACMTLTDNGQMLALTQQKSTRGPIYKAWKMASGEVMLTIGPDHPFKESATLQSVAISPDGEIVAGNFSDQSVMLWHLATGESEEIMMGEILSDGSSPTPFSPDGKMLVISNKGRITVWDVASGEALQSFPWSRHAIFSPNGKLLATTNEEGTVDVWEVRTGRKKLSLKEFGSDAKALGFSADSKLLVTGEGGYGEGSLSGSKIEIKVWNLTTSQQQAILSGYEGTAYPAITFSPDGRTLAIGNETVSLWDPLTGRQLFRLMKGSEWEEVVFLAFNPNRKMLVAGFPGGIRLWHAAAVETRQ